MTAGAHAGRAGGAGALRARRPASHGLFCALLVLSLAAALVVQAYAAARPRSSTTSTGRIVDLPAAGAVLDLSGPEIRASRAMPGAVALTFDDGPDPRWTPRVLEVLARHGVPATFFVQGAAASRHPGLVRAVRRAGHEIGSHTFTHADLGAVGRWRANVELGLTQMALAGATGRTTPLLRLPYSSLTTHVTEGELEAGRAAARLGYLVVVADRDAQDWRRPGVEAIVANAMPAAGQGGVVLLHDGGGDRSQTVAALDRLIPELKARGHRFATVSGAVGLPPVDAPAGLLQRAQGWALLLGLGLARGVSWLVAALLVPIGVLTVLRSAAVLALARRHVRSPRRQRAAPFLPPVTVVVPAYNEEVGIAHTVRSLAGSHHPEVEVIVVDDGSTDRTAEVVDGLGLPNVWVLQKPNAGKPSALNLGVAAGSHDVIVMVDGDTVFEPDTLTTLVQPLADPAVGAVSGNTKVGNRRSLLGCWQHIEYVLGFNLDRRVYDVLGCMPTIPGAVGAFRRRALDEVGGVSGDTLAEDTDLTMAVQRAGWRVAYEPRARAWTEAPATLGALWRQRYRWSYGTMQAMWKHRGAVRTPGSLGRIGLPYLLFFQVLLPLLAPAVDLWALHGLISGDAGTVLAWWAAFNLVQLGVGAYAFRLDGERLAPLWLAPLQQLVYRQLMYLVVIQSVITAVAGTRVRWQKLQRRGLDLPAPAGAARGSG